MQNFLKNKKKVVYKKVLNTNEDNFLNKTNPYKNAIRECKLLNYIGNSSENHILIISIM